MLKEDIMKEIERTLELVKECQEGNGSKEQLQEELEKLEELQRQLVSSITQKGKELDDLQM